MLVTVGFGPRWVRVGRGRRDVGRGGAGGRRGGEPDADQGEGQQRPEGVADPAAVRPGSDFGGVEGGDGLHVGCSL
jgi:hypothetical protein